MADASELRLVDQGRYDTTEGAENTADAGKQARRHAAEGRRPPAQAKQQLAHGSRRERRAGPADGQYGIVPLGLVEAVGEVAGEVPLADGLAGGQLAVAEQQVRLAGQHPWHLAGQGLEEGGGTHDRVAQAAAGQVVLESELGLLESEPRPLHADRRQQDEVGNSGGQGRVQQPPVGLVLDRPGIANTPTAGGEAGKNRVETLARKAVFAQAARVSDVADTDFGAGQGAADASGLSRAPTPLCGRTRQTTRWPRPQSSRTRARPI